MSEQEKFPEPPDTFNPIKIVTVMLATEIADGLSRIAREDRRTQSAKLSLLIEHFMATTTLTPLPKDVMVRRSNVGKGEQKLRRYTVPAQTMKALEDAEALGYTKSFIIEKAIQAALEAK